MVALVRVDVGRGQRVAERLEGGAGAGHGGQAVLAEAPAPALPAAAGLRPPVRRRGRSASARAGRAGLRALDWCGASGARSGARRRSREVGCCAGELVTRLYLDRTGGEIERVYGRRWCRLGWRSPRWTAPSDGGSFEVLFQVPRGGQEAKPVGLFDAMIALTILRDLLTMQRPLQNRSRIQINLLRCILPRSLCHQRAYLTRNMCETESNELKCGKYNSANGYRLLNSLETTLQSILVTKHDENSILDIIASGKWLKQQYLVIFPSSMASSKGEWVFGNLMQQCQVTTEGRLVFHISADGTVPSPGP